MMTSGDVEVEYGMLNVHWCASDGFDDANEKDKCVMMMMTISKRKGARTGGAKEDINGCLNVRIVGGVLYRDMRFYVPSNFQFAPPTTTRHRILVW